MFGMGSHFVLYMGRMLPRETYGHWNGVRAHMGTGRELRHIWAPNRYPSTYGHRNGARAHLGMGMVPGYI